MAKLSARGRHEVQRWTRTWSDEHGELESEVRLMSDNHLLKTYRKDGKRLDGWSDMGRRPDWPQRLERLGWQPAGLQ